MATNLARAESPSNAEQKPVRHGAKAQPCAELSKKEDFQKKTSNLFNKNQNYANPPAGGHHANPATPTDFVTASFSEAAAQANRSWADLAEDNNQESEDPFITVQRKKRRRGSAESPAAAAPSSNIRGAGAIRRPRSSTGWAPRAEEIRTTRAHIVEARARQASSTEDHCVYVERSPELEPFHYMRAIERMFGGTREVFQLTKMNGHFLVGLANRGMAERLVNEGLEVEGTLHRAFPFRKRAERITVGNLPFFVGDAAVISALSSFGRVTSIAPKLMKAGPYIYNDGRREAFIILREGMTIERLPTRLDITIKGEAWPAYLSSGIRCSRCRGQGHRRANCPLLARRTTAPGPATPTSPTSVPPATAPRLPQQPSAQPPPPASPSPTMEVSDVPPTSRAALHPPAALRKSSPAPSALPAEDAPLAPPPMTPAPSLRTPGSREPAAPTPDVEMSIVEETSASFTSTAKNATRIDLDAFIERHPSVSFAETDALGLGREEVLDLLSSRTKTQRSVPLLPLSQCNALAGLIRQILDLRPGAASNLYKVLPPPPPTGKKLGRFDDDMNPGTDNDFTVVKTKRAPRIIEFAYSRCTILQQRRRQEQSSIESSARSVPRAQEIPTTRAISQRPGAVGVLLRGALRLPGTRPELQPFHYLRALDRLLGRNRRDYPDLQGKRPPTLGLANRGLAERLINTALRLRALSPRAFPFRKRAERITVSNLPFFVEDSPSYNALGPLGASQSSRPNDEGGRTPTPTAARGVHRPHEGCDNREASPPASTHHQRRGLARLSLFRHQVFQMPRTRPWRVVTACTVSTPHVYTCSTRPWWVVTACTVSTTHVYTCSTRPWWVVTACTVSTPHVYTCSTRPWRVVTACTVSTPHVYTCSTRPWWVVTACTVSTPHVYTCSTRPWRVVTACTVSTPHVYTCSTRPWWVVTACTVSTPHVYTCSTRPWRVVTACTVSTPYVYTRPCGHASRELPSFSPLASGITSRMATNLARAESPSNAEQKPVRHGAKAQPCAELSKKEDFQKKTSNLFNKNQNYANPPAGGHHANPATPTDFVTASFSEAAAQANRSWADLAEDNNQESEDPFITVQRKKRRRGSAESPAAAAPSSNIRGAGAIRRPRSSTGWAPRAEEIRTTRAHIVEARARQASSTEDHCVYVERSPELEPFHYMRAIERMFGGTREVFQLTKMNGHFLVGLANRGMAERLVNEGLEVEGTLHRAFPFRKRAERITVGNLPFFVGDAAVISALSSFGRVTSIAPKLMKAGPYIYNDGRREAFIILREGMTIERLPTRLDITIKGEAWPAYLSSGIRCSRCRGQGHRRANCPLLARRTTAPGPATPTSPTSVPPATAPRLPQQPSAQPPPPASPSPTMEVSDVPPTSRAALHPPAALRKSSPAPSALPAEDAPLAPPPMTPAPSLRTPGSREPAAPTPDVEMSIVEETSASFTSTAKNATRIDLDAFIERHPSVSFAETDALGLGREEVLDLLSSRTKTQRSVPLLPLSQCNALAGLIRQILDLRPGAASNLYKVLGQVKAELRTTPAAVPPTPPLPAPRPAEPMLPTTHREELTPPLMTPPPPAPTDMEEDDPMTEKERDTPPPPAPRLAETTPPIPHGEKTSPHIATPPPPLSCQFIDDRWTEADDILYELNQERDWGVGISESDITEAVIYPEDREPLIRRLSTRRRSLLAAFISAAIERARDADPFVREGICNASLNMPNSALPRSPGSAGQKPGRPSIPPPTGSENSAKNEFYREIYKENSNTQEYANPPADGGNVNLAAARVDVTSGSAATLSSNSAAFAIRNWADYDEDMNPGTDNDFTVVKTKKRRRESSNSPTAAAPSSNSGGARSSLRLQSSARSVPRAQEIPTTRAHITEARARQASSSEEHCVYLEHGPELQPFHYLRALDRLLGGTAGIIQISKVNGHQLLGLANRGLAERLINNGLEVEGTLLRAFPFRKRAERITVSNLPFFVEDSAIINALRSFGRITSIAPKMMKAGPYTYTDGRREAFIVLHEGVTTERLPTRLDITIKGEAWPAYLSTGIKCSRCHGQGHRRANCPLLAGRVNTTSSAPPASPAGVPPSTAPAPPQRPTSQHPAPAPPLEIFGASPAARAAIQPAGAPRPSPTAPPASPAEETPSAPPPVTPAPSLQAPEGPVGPRPANSQHPEPPPARPEFVAPRDPLPAQKTLGPAAPTPDVEMSIVEETSASSTSSAKNATRNDLDAFIERHPSVSFAGTDALGLGREEVLDLLSSRTRAQRKGPLLSPPQGDALAGLIKHMSTHVVPGH
ncbi:hypothetical protein LAZ67_15003170, partial [Cordylochernes scorpioides]